MHAKATIRNTFSAGQNKKVQTHEKKCMPAKPEKAIRCQQGNEDRKACEKDKTFEARQQSQKLIKRQKQSKNMSSEINQKSYKICSKSKFLESLRKKAIIMTGQMTQYIAKATAKRLSMIHKLEGITRHRENKYGKKRAKTTANRRKI